MAFSAVAEIRKLRGQFLQPCLFIGRINDDRSIGMCKSVYQSFGELATRIVVAIGKEFPVVQDAIAVDRVKRPLEGNGLVGSRALIERDRRHHRLEVEIASRWPEAVQQTSEIRRHVGLSARRGVPDDGLLRRERKIRRYGRDGLDAVRLEFARAGRRQAGEIGDPVSGFVRRAPVPELARIGRSALDPWFGVGKSDHAETIPHGGKAGGQIDQSPRQRRRRHPGG